MSTYRSFGQQSHMESFAEGFTVLENPNLPINVSATDLPSNRDQWKSDRTCLICKVVFKLLQHKYRCKFCYRGVCNRCSAHLFLHPEFGVLKRCCNSCYNRFLTYTIKEELAGKIYASQGRLTVIEDQLQGSRARKRENEETMRDLETEVRRRRLKVVQSETTYEKELRTRKQQLAHARKAKEQIGERRSRISQRIAEFRSLSEKRRLEKEEHSQSLSMCEAQTRALKSQLCELQEEANHIIHSYATRSQSLSPCDTLKPVNMADRWESEELMDTEASVSKDGDEAKEAYEMASPAGDDLELFNESMHLKRLLADLESENISLRDNLSSIPRRPILSERQITSIPTSEVRSVPTRSCCTLF